MHDIQKDQTKRFKRKGMHSYLNIWRQIYEAKWKFFYIINRQWQWCIYANVTVMHCGNVVKRCKYEYISDAIWWWERWIICNTCVVFTPPCHFSLNAASNALVYCFLYLLPMSHFMPQNSDVGLIAIQIW